MLVAADLATPYRLAGGLFLGGLRLDVRVIVGIGCRGCLGEGHGVGHIGNKQGVRAEIHRVTDPRADHRIDTLCHIRNAVFRTCPVAEIGKFVGISAALEAKALKYVKFRLLRED